MTETAAAGWPLAATLALAVVGHIRGTRRRNALNEALHELRRPLQALLLARPAAPGTAMALALAALARLDREINGGPERAAEVLVSCRSVLEQAAERWAPVARRGGGTIDVRWEAAGAKVLADPAELEAAVDNLLANALEHGRPPVTIQATLLVGRIRIAVADAGGGRIEGSSSGRGHGLRIVRRFAARQGGRFFLRRGAGGSVAVLELPLALVDHNLAA